ncbi:MULTISPECIES: hypothetical protein [unclassified Brucella]|uniref:hypothetical protein n=1 Tax=unclassified Brucella TaxID=2632610 RepID=UPI0012AD937B|nr:MULTISPECIES: hypothetical protein [unclassified Brucella]
MDDSFPKNAPISFEQMHKAVSKDFIDPSSAQYKGLTIHDQPGRGLSICGWVNSKNSFGGYTRFYPFGVLADTKFAMVNTSFDDSNLAKLADMSFAKFGCREKLGYDLP